MKKKRKSTIPGSIKGVAAVVIIALCVNVVSLQVRINDLRTQSAELSREISRKTLENKELKEANLEGDTAESIAKTARESLGYAFPGERVYKDSSGQQ